jgi:hypothetical protein
MIIWGNIRLIYPCKVDTTKYKNNGGYMLKINQKNRMS